MSTTYQSSGATAASSSSSKAPAGASLSAKRLFVGNLAESADEYTIIQFLSRYGKIAKFDFLFHKSGPKRGRPRGYAFVEYATAEEALKTTLELNDKLLMGRKISIKAANEAPDYSSMPGSSGAWRGSGQKSTTLSILKGHQKPVSRQGKISALEAKLQALESERAGTPSGAESEGDSRGGTPSASTDVQSTFTPALVSTSTSASTSTSSAVPSLPSKPNRDTIQRGEVARRAKEDSAPDRYDSSKQKDKFLARTGKAQKEEAPKVTLASLGLSMTQ